jgi:hypothetical protein
MDAPAQGDHWQTEEASRILASKPLFIFSPMQSGSNTATTRDALAGELTNLGCNLGSLADSEVKTGYYSGIPY